MEEYDNDFYWGLNDPITLEKLNKMAHNDRYLYERIVNAPRGLVAWKQINGNINISSSSSGTSIASYSKFIEANRKLKLTLTFRSITMGSGVGPNLIDFQFFVDGVQVELFRTNSTLQSTDISGTSYHVIYENVDSGTRDFEVVSHRGVLYTATINGSGFYPIQFYVEDLGTVEYVTL